MLVVTHFDSETFDSRGTRQVTDLCKLAKTGGKRPVHLVLLVEVYSLHQVQEGAYRLRS